MDVNMCQSSSAVSQSRSTVTHVTINPRVHLAASQVPLTTSQLLCEHPSVSVRYIITNSCKLTPMATSQKVEVRLQRMTTQNHKW